MTRRDFELIAKALASSRPTEVMTAAVADLVAKKPQDFGPEEIRHLARSYIAALDAIREYGPCPACESPWCRTMATILAAADEE